MIQESKLKKLENGYNVTNHMLVQTSKQPIVVCCGTIIYSSTLAGAW